MTLHEKDNDAMQQTKPSAAPHPTLTRYYQIDSERPAYIKHLFDASAPHYDRISGLMSFGTDKRYRRRVLLDWGLAPGMKMLDVACGTGMVAGPASEIVGPSGRVLALDPSPGMLREAVRRGRVAWAVRGTAEKLPFADNSFDFLTMGFALRHVSDLLVAFAEYRRVLKPGGRALILEITSPSSKVAYGLFKFYLKSLLPSITRLSTFNSDAQQLMAYHWDTVEQCVPPEMIMDAMGQVRFDRIERRIQGAVVNEYTGRKPNQS